MKTTDIRRTRRFPNTFRFNGELTVLNDDSEFEKSFREIHPPE